MADFALTGESEAISGGPPSAFVFPLLSSSHLALSSHFHLCPVPFILLLMPSDLVLTPSVLIFMLSVLVLAPKILSPVGGSSMATALGGVRPNVRHQTKHSEAELRDR